MDLKTIYLDTNLWNRLFDQQVDAQWLLQELKVMGANLAVSGQTVYELARTFDKKPSRARDLFQYLKLYVDAGIIGAHDNMQQLHGEIRALNTRASAVIAFYGLPEYQELKAEVDKLAQGVFDGRVKQFIAERMQSSKDTRADQKIHFDDKQDVKDRLKAVSVDQLPSWLQSELLDLGGIASLTRHIQRIYADITDQQAISNAHSLLRIPQSRIAKGIVRADLYSNWRCAHRGSNPRDLMDDMYHVLNASYCSIYATAEPGQTEYASLLLPSGVQISIYDEQTPVGEWLLSLV